MNKIIEYIKLIETVNMYLYIILFCFTFIFTENIILTIIIANIVFLVIKYKTMATMVDYGIFMMLCLFAYPLTKYNIISCIFVAFISFLIIKAKTRRK